MSMIERVARAICAKEGYLPNHWRHFKGHAMAAIEAMREPTDEMERAGEASGGAFEGACDVIYHAMIDAALATPTETSRDQKGRGG